MNKAAHFGNTTTSRNESSHAAIKAYLHTSTGGHKENFGAIWLCLEDQHRNITQDNVQQKMKPRHAIKTQLFQNVIGFVYLFSLLKFLEEKGKFPKKTHQWSDVSLYLFDLAKHEIFSLLWNTRLTTQPW